MKFTLEIAIGNDGVRTPAHVGVLLARTGAQLVESPPGNSSASIYDVNGNVVGFWRITDD